ncbi:hypothetical protein PLESTB_000031200 [Pleodorina starrii]|uniref:Uncharacterized protein n=1 Tax=Pleodorina starrii TaxID=330485 RepID=A0A9W6B922_9CHLO|nr:hypothetical protein PLESTM_001103100 [Pleodorina starrii]GLC47839.1 hypothetical protein PLESTB_000031200 [Pleodorina starrii]GLC70736.1 hypothetical protein PLESTF_001027900 [Pleodorina starrii]
MGPALCARQPNGPKNREADAPGWPKARQRKHVITEALPRRLALLSALSLSGILQETEPLTGSCPTCVGVVDGTLGSCAGLRSCLSSFDDRPGHFVAPWTYDTVGRTEAVKLLAQAVQTLGGRVLKEENGTSYGYVYATWESWQGTDDVEFLLPDGDNTVVLRSAARVQGVPDLGRNEQRLEQLRVELGWELVPILRNRQRALFFVESSWDRFGPVPPTDPDYRFGLDLDQEQ